MFKKRKNNASNKDPASYESVSPLLIKVSRDAVHGVMRPLGGGLWCCYRGLRSIRECLSTKGSFGKNCVSSRV